MSGISFSGIGSGLPVNEIVAATMKAEAAPLQRMELDRKFAQSQISAYGQLATRLDALGSAMGELKGLDKFQQLAARSSNDNLFTASASHPRGATAGSYNLVVEAEARNYQHITQGKNTEDALTGTLTFAGLGPDNSDIVLDINGKKLDEVRAMINEDDRLKGRVSANLVNTSGTEARLVMKSELTGDTGRFTATFTGASLAKDTAASSPAFDPDNKSTSLDARITVDGIEATSSTNTFTNLITGVDITLAQGASLQGNKSANLSVRRDDDAILDSLNKFVKAYNDVIIHLNEAKNGPLKQEGVIRSVNSMLRDELMSPTNGDDKQFLSLVGINTFVETGGDGSNPSNGTLRIDNAAFTKALDENFDLVANMIGNPETGYAARFETLAKRMTSTTVVDGQINKGLIELRRDGLNAEVRRIDDRIEATEYRLELFEERLRAQFNAIEGMVANMNATSGYLAQQLSNLPGYTRNKK